MTASPSINASEPGEVKLGLVAPTPTFVSVRPGLSPVKNSKRSAGEGAGATANARHAVDA